MKSNCSSWNINAISHSNYTLKTLTSPACGRTGIATKTSEAGRTVAWPLESLGLLSCASISPMLSKTKYVFDNKNQQGALERQVINSQNQCLHIFSTKIWTNSLSCIATLILAYNFCSNWYSCKNITNLNVNTSKKQRRDKKMAFSNSWPYVC